MAFLLKITFYSLWIICSLIAAFYFIANLVSQQPSTTLRERIFTGLASVVALTLLYWAFRLGHQQAQWLYGVGLVVAAALAFVLIMLIGVFTAKHINWQ